MADRNGYIGRAPGDSSVTVARQVFSPTGVQTNFTFASGYVPGYLDVYLNGAKLIVAQDFTATDGSVVGLTSFAQSGDVVEAVAFKAFNAAAVTQAADFTVTGNQTNNGTLSVTGGTTLSNLIVTGITTLSAGSSVSFATTAFDLGAGTNLNIGIVTVTTLSGGEVNGSDANFTGILTAASASFSGNVSVGGTLTYEDVTNIDSVGVITAREGIKVTTGGIDIAAGGIEVGGISTFQGSTNTFANEVTITAGGLEINGGGLDVAGITTLSSTLSVAAGGISVVSGGSSIIGVVTATSFEGDGSTLSNLPSSGDANDITASLFT
jgi:hypothetical protein